MEASLRTSAQAGKRNTTRTKVLTTAQNLEILQQALLNCQNAGISIDTGSYTDESGITNTVVILANIDLINGNLVAIDGNGGDA